MCVARQASAIAWRREIILGKYYCDSVSDVAQMEKRAYYYYKKLLPQINSKLQWIIDSNQPNYNFLSFLFQRRYASENAVPFVERALVWFMLTLKLIVRFQKHTNFFSPPLFSAFRSLRQTKKIAVYFDNFDGNKIGNYFNARWEGKHHIIYTVHVICLFAWLKLIIKMSISHSLFFLLNYIQSKSKFNYIYMCISHPSYKW